MPQTYHGSCHCGRVKFELQSQIDHLFECNCSICHQRGALWHGAPGPAMRILAGEEELSLYQFGTNTAKHYFCRHCGIHPFARPRLDPNLWIVNARCIEELDLSALEVKLFDGQHWEEAARALLASMR